MLGFHRSCSLDWQGWASKTILEFARVLGLMQLCVYVAEDLGIFGEYGWVLITRLPFVDASLVGLGRYFEVDVVSLCFFGFEDVSTEFQVFLLVEFDGQVA